MSAWGEEIETGVSGQASVVDPSVLDINNMSTEDFMGLSDWQFTQVLTQILAEINVKRRRIAELNPYVFEHKALTEDIKYLTNMKSACQSILRAAQT